MIFGKISLLYLHYTFKSSPIKFFKRVFSKRIAKSITVKKRIYQHILSFERMVVVFPNKNSNVCDKIQLTELLYLNTKNNLR